MANLAAPRPGRCRGLVWRIKKKVVSLEKLKLVALQLQVANTLDHDQTGGGSHQPLRILVQSFSTLLLLLLLYCRADVHACWSSGNATRCPASAYRIYVQMQGRRL